MSVIYASNQVLSGTCIKDRLKAWRCTPLMSALGTRPAWSTVKTRAARTTQRNQTLSRKAKKTRMDSNTAACELESFRARHGLKSHCFYTTQNHLEQGTGHLTLPPAMVTRLASNSQPSVLGSLSTRIIGIHCHWPDV